MSHLNLETLARLVDESPDPTENGHLDICEQCRSELESLRADAAALRQLPDPEPPIAAWVALERRLGREGLLRRITWRTYAMQAAAVLTIFILGSIAGALTMRRQTPALATTTNATTAAPVHFTAQQPAFNDSQSAQSPIIEVAATPAVEPALGGARLAATPEEAVARLREAERTYLSALGRYSELNAARTENADPVARLAALESIVATTRAALGQAPADPVINGYHLTAVAQRDATLREIAKSQQTWY